MVVEDDIVIILDELADNNSLFVVEGIKDKKALARLGIFNVITLGKKPLYAVVEEIAQKVKEVVLLVDLDPEGKKIYSVLKKDLQKNGIKVDDSIRALLFKTPIRHIEGLDTYIEHSTNNN